MAQDNSWFKLFRKIKEWEWYQDHITKAVYLHCLIEARTVDKSYRGEMLEKGTFVTTSSGLAADLNLSRQQVRTALDKLVSTNNITKTATNKNLIIKVVNWEYYQDKKGNSNHQNNQQVNQQITNKQPTNNQQKDNNIYTYKDISSLKEKDIDFLTVITRIEQTIETQQFEGATVGAYNANIIARKLGLYELVDNKHSGTITIPITGIKIVKDGSDT